MYRFFRLQESEEVLLNFETGLDSATICLFRNTLILMYKNRNIIFCMYVLLRKKYYLHLKSFDIVTDFFG